LRLLLVARLLFDKGIAEYAEAGRLLKERHQQQPDQVPAIELQLLGPFYAQNPQAISPEQIAHWQSEGWLHYLGETADVTPFVAGCDALVLPSYAEGLPRTVLEAMSMAKPVLATDVVGCRDLVVHEVTGLLCEARNAHSLADAIERFSQLSLAQRQQMGEAGRAKLDVRACWRILLMLKWWRLMMRFCLISNHVLR
jgi:glycosyltransferase involved in cell wall biosynthesis